MARILVVEDDPAVRSLVVELLARAGYEVCEAGNGLEAGKQLSQGGTFDLLLTDILMPERDGLEMLMGLRREQRRIPVIAMTGLTGDSTLLLKVASHLGAQRTLRKPFSNEQLLSTVAEVLAQSPAPI